MVDSFLAWLTTALLRGSYDVMTREDAARWLLEREVRIVHRPLIFDVENEG